MFKNIIAHRPPAAHSGQSATGRPVVALIASILIGLIGVLAIIGWATDNALLKAFLPEQRPINPIAALGLINLSLIFLAYYLHLIWVHRFLGVLSILLGLVALTSLPIDTLLFSQKVAASGAHTAIADTAAICFILCGLSALLSLTRRLPLRIVGNTAVGIILVIALLNMAGQIYAHDFTYGISGNFAMAYNLASAFVIAAVSGALLVLRKHQLKGLSDVSLLGWLIIIAFVALQIGGYLYWLQLHNKDKADAAQVFTEQSQTLKTLVTTQTTAYVDALHGFEGFYRASDFVSQSDFATYYNSLNLEQNYPGLRSIVYIASVKTADIPAMVRSYRNDRSFFPEGNPNYKIVSQADTPLHFYSLYRSSYGQAFTSYAGIDIATIPGRYDIYTAALQSGEPYASGSVTFLTDPGKPAEAGFFIAMPVQTAGSSTPIGVVNANFSYETFFTSIFGTTLRKNDLNVNVSDEGRTIYESDGYKGDTTYRTTLTLPIVGRSWTMSVAAGTAYGVTDEQRRTQTAFVVSLFILSLMMISMFIIQARTRHRAVVLANSMTADIRRERRRTLEAKEKDEAILRSIGDGLIVLNIHGAIDMNNAAAERLLGVEEGGLLGKTFSDFAASRTAAGKALAPSQRPYEKVLHTGKQLSTKLFYKRTDGTRFPAELNVSPIIRNGKIAGVIEVFRDISSDVELDRAKSEFVSLASHQLRTPLSAINWYAEMLLNGDGGKLSDEQSAYVREIFEGNQRMIELVNSLLDVSRLELDRMSFTPEEIDLTAMENDLESEMQITINEKKMQVTRLIDHDLPHITTDRKMIRMAMQNLMSNALKYTVAGGHVTVVLTRPSWVAIEKAHLKASGDYVLISVRDTGFGIPKEQQKRIFEKMFRADNVRTLDVEGTGLGLYIVKKVAHQMGGWIGFDSVEGKGTTFTMIVPVTPPGARTKAKDS